jgi:hypothetical protein
MLHAFIDVDHVNVMQIAWRDWLQFSVYGTISIIVVFAYAPI